MASVRKCYNEECECNVEGIYCDACEITISEDGVCENFFPKMKEETDEEVNAYVE